MRPTLRPGSHVLRRADDTLQVGLDPSRAIILPADESTTRSLRLLATCADTEQYAEGGLIALLEGEQLLVDAEAALPLLGSTPDPGARHARAALARDHGAAAGDALTARRASTVEVVPYGDDDVSTGLAAELAGLLRTAELGVADRQRHRRARRGRPPAAGVLVGAGEPHRDLVDGWVRDDVPHLVVRLSEGTATVGPFVSPGRTACLRCLDAHHTDADPSWPLLVEQYSSATSRPRADGVPEPVDPLIARIALAWAARDLVSHAEGRQPSSWSATIRFDPLLAEVRAHAWLRHPECGCSWA